MSEGLIEYARHLKNLLNCPRAAYALAKATAQHRRMEKEFRKRIIRLCPSDAHVRFPHLQLSPQKYWARNFFSILFISIFEAMGVPAPRRRKYSTILHAVRGVVTAVDNILDDEDKGAVRLTIEGGSVLPNVLLVLLHHGVLHDAITEVAPDAEAGRRASSELMHALFAIAQEESGEESAVETVLPPCDVLAQVHAFRGGQLLQLAFVVPEATEPSLAAEMRAAREGVNSLGLALQVLDDVTDFAEDIARRNHNILRSWVVHHGPDGLVSDEELRQMPPAALARPHESFPEATAQVLVLAVDMALAAFERLRSIGHVIDRAAAMQLIEAMFQLRGLGGLWSCYQRAASRAALTPPRAGQAMPNCLCTAPSCAHEPVLTKST